ncbi:MAG: hypothetical protein JW950_05060 [Deltaproteobacteria bacterium]|nr:hypothetical protein [Deltaproteobacteria bacterium]
MISIFVVGTSGFHLFTGWRYIQSLCASVITLSTFGYGDYYPNIEAGQIFTLF